MKQVSIFIMSILAAFTIYSQQDMNVSVTGNKNLQVLIDGREINLHTGSIIDGNKTTISINNVDTGRHILQVIRTDQNTNRPDRISSIFNLRYGYDMQVKVSANGSLEFIETKRAGIYDKWVPMGSLNFNNLLKNVRSQKSNSARENLVSNAFKSGQNHFTSSQARQLIRLVNSESSRVQLAKLAYPIITDRINFYQVYDLLNSQNSRNELEDFVYNYSAASAPGVAMSDANFNSLFQTIREQWPVSAQMNSLTNAFNNTSNYFTTNQAGRLIQLVNGEANRLQLAKLSYRAIIDRGNFHQIYELFSSQSSKNELEAYVNNYNAGTSTGAAMSDAAFNSLYQTIQQQWPVSAQMNSLTNAFNNTGNYFTTYQAGRLIRLVSAESNRLQLAKLSYRAITDRSNFSQIYDLLSSQSSKNELEAYVNNYNAGTSTGAAMSDANFNSLYQTIQQQWPVSVQMNSLTNAFNNTGNYFTVYQAGRLIQLVSAESNRLQLAKLAYRSITDRVNFSQIYDLFSSQSSKDELAAYVKNYGSGTVTRLPMSDADFNALYQSIQVQFFPNEKMNSLTGVFSNTGNYFTTAQAKQLIRLVSFESNRLQLAKLSYRTITDRNNFNQLYELLGSQASKDELDAYVKAYKD